MSKKAAPKRRRRKPKAGAEVYGNRSVMTGFSVLRALSSIGRAATLGEIAATANMTASRAHRFLAALQHVDAVAQQTASGKYDLGPALIELGVTALGRIDAVRRAIDAIDDLAQTTGLVTLLCAWGSHGPTVIKWTQGNRISTIHVPEGVNLPLLTTATGNVFLAHLPSIKTRDVLSDETAQEGLNRSAVESRVRQISDKVRRKGVAYSSGKAHPHLVKLAAPVFQWNGDLALVITLIGDSLATNMNEDSKAADILKAATAKLSRENGYLPREHNALVARAIDTAQTDAA